MWSNIEVENVESRNGGGVENCQLCVDSSLKVLRNLIKNFHHLLFSQLNYPWGVVLNKLGDENYFSEEEEGVDG